MIKTANFYDQPIIYKIRHSVSFLSQLMMAKDKNVTV
jgi:hypothetical protein